MTIEQSPKIIPYYQTERGILMNMTIDRRSENYRMSGKPLTDTFHTSWFLVDGEATFGVLEKHAGKKAINSRYELRNPTIGLQAIIPADKITKDDDYQWDGEYRGMQGLYEHKFEWEDLGFKPFECQPDNRGSLTFSSLGDPTKFSYKLANTGSDRGEEQSIDYKTIFNQYGWMTYIAIDEICKAMLPEVAWHLAPCSLTSEVSYRIIRLHLKNNIDPKWAEITSDYDFCFTIKKKVRVVPYKHTYELMQWGKRRRPKFKTDLVEYKLHEIFEMTHNGEKYKGYTVIDGFRGDSLADLGETIDAYLRCLTEAVNEPLATCPKCDGMAVVNFNKIPTNERARFGVGVDKVKAS
jgi:hypothetical protein